jgi:hypothetical protein
VSSEESVEIAKLKVKLHEYAAVLRIARRALLDTNGMLVVDENSRGGQRRIDYDEELDLIARLDV